MSDTIDYFDMNTAPMRIGTVRLRVRDLDKVSSFYQAALGLDAIEAGKSRILLGQGASPLLEIMGDPALTPADPRQAGLFHTAFLLPQRADLARWLGHIAKSGIALHGASDHIVSEAIYLADPEGNGIEVYIDRPVSHWHDGSGNIQMTTDPLDIEDLLNAAGGTVWQGFPEGGTIGHVHLRVGDTVKADRFYRDVLGLDVAVDYPGASFYGSGGYHHQLAGNVWSSRNAPSRPQDMAGLDAVEIIVRDKADSEAIARRAEMAAIPVTREDGSITLSDPWGTKFNLTH